MNAIIALRNSLLQIKGINEKNVDGIVMGIAQNPTNIFDALASMNPGLLDKFRSNPSSLVREFTPFPVILERRDRIVKLLSEPLYKETGLRAEEIGEKLGFDLVGDTEAYLRLARSLDRYHAGKRG